MYLKKVNRNYSFRYRIPNELQKYFGSRTEIIKSLQTENARIAKQKARVLSAELALLISKVRTMQELDIYGVDTIVSEWAQERLETDLNGRIEKSSIEGDQGNMPLTKVQGYTKRISQDLKQDLAKLKTIRVE